MKAKDLTGHRFGRLEVLYRAPGPSSSKFWVCKCDCGTLRVVLSESILSGKTKSCGCLRRQASSSAFSQCLEGQRFDRLVVVERTGSDKHKQAMWRCRCDCGNESIVSTNKLRKQNTRSCGCLHKEKAAESLRVVSTLHGLSDSSEWLAWKNAKDRCFNPNHTHYDNYGGRGITMSDEFRNSFETFYAHVGPKPSPDLSLDRVNVNGHYERGNLRWATALQQIQNRRPLKNVKTGKFVKLTYPLF